MTLHLPHLRTAPHPSLAPNRWGYVRIGYARHWIQHRLVMFPPGASADDRHRVRMWTSARIWAPAVWLSMYTLGTACGDPTPWRTCVASTVTLTLLIYVFVRSGRPRRGLRVMVSWSGTGCGLGELEHHRRLSAIVRSLERADDELSRGLISVADHEMIWGRCYSELG